MVEPANHIAHERSPPGAFSARIAAVSVASRRSCLLHLCPGLVKNRFDLLRPDHGAVPAELAGIDHRRWRVAVQQRVAGIQSDGSKRLMGHRFIVRIQSAARSGETRFRQALHGAEPGPDLEVRSGATEQSPARRAVMICHTVPIGGAGEARLPMCE